MEKDSSTKMDCEPSQDTSGSSSSPNTMRTENWEDSELSNLKFVNLQDILILSSLTRCPAASPGENPKCNQTKTFDERREESIRQQGSPLDTFCNFFILTFVSFIINTLCSWIANSILFLFTSIAPSNVPSSMMDRLLRSFEDANLEDKCQKAFERRFTRKTQDLFINFFSAQDYRVKQLSCLIFSGGPVRIPRRPRRPPMSEDESRELLNLFREIANP